MVVIGLSLGAAGCTRLNPAFEDDNGAAEGSGTSPGSDSASTLGSDESGLLPSDTGTASGDTTAGNISDSAESVGSGPTDPPDPAGYPCDVDQVDITLEPAPPECSETDNGQILPVTLDSLCVEAQAVGPSLRVSPASGCNTGACVRMDDTDVVITTEDIHLGDALQIGNVPECRVIWAYGFPIFGNPNGLCSWEALAIWSVEGQLELAVGSGIPDDGSAMEIRRPYGVGFVQISSSNIQDTTCGEPSTSCAPGRSGWREFSFGTMSQPALPDASPTDAFLGDQPLSVINDGLQFDLACNRFGRWGVVPKGRESILP